MRKSTQSGKAHAAIPSDNRLPPDRSESAPNPYRRRAKVRVRGGSQTNVSDATFAGLVSIYINDRAGSKQRDV
jgi:hypothetical protein